MLGETESKRRREGASQNKPNQCGSGITLLIGLARGELRASRHTMLTQIAPQLGNKQHEVHASPSEGNRASYRARAARCTQHQAFFPPLPGPGEAECAHPTGPACVSWRPGFPASQEGALPADPLEAEKVPRWDFYSTKYLPDQEIW